MVASEFSTQVVLIKAKMGNEFRRFRMAAYNADMERLSSILRHHFSIDRDSELIVSYEDADGDFIRMKTDSDFVEACHHALPKEHGEWELVVTVESGASSFSDAPKLDRADFATLLRIARELDSELSSSISQALRVIARALEHQSPKVPVVQGVASVNPQIKTTTGHVEFGDFQMAESIPPEQSNYETVQGAPFNVFREIERGEEEEDLLKVPSRAQPELCIAPSQVHDEAQDSECEDSDVDVRVPDESSSSSSEHNEVDLGCAAAIEGFSQLQKFHHRQLRYVRYKSFVPSFPPVGAASSSSSEEDDDVPEFETTPQQQQQQKPESRQSIFWGPPAISGTSLSFSTRFHNTNNKPQPQQQVFTVPFPATFSFPPSPTASQPVFSLSESTPFPFAPAVGKTTTTTTATASTSTSTPRIFTRSTGTFASVRTSETSVQTRKSVTDSSTQTEVEGVNAAIQCVESVGSAANEEELVAREVPSIRIENTVSNLVMEVAVCVPVVEEPVEEEVTTSVEVEVEKVSVIDEVVVPVSPTMSMASDSDDFVVV